MYCRGVMAPRFCWAILNAFVRPFLLILSGRLFSVTLGFFILILNGLLLLVVQAL